MESTSLQNDKKESSLIDLDDSLILQSLNNRDSKIYDKIFFGSDEVEKSVDSSSNLADSTDYKEKTFTNVDQERNIQENNILPSQCEVRHDAESDKKEVENCRNKNNTALLPNERKEEKSESCNNVVEEKKSSDDKTENLNSTKSGTTLSPDTTLVVNETSIDDKNDKEVVCEEASSSKNEKYSTQSRKIDDGSWKSTDSKEILVDETNLNVDDYVSSNKNVPITEKEDVNISQLPEKSFESDALINNMQRMNWLKSSETNIDFKPNTTSETDQNSKQLLSSLPKKDNNMENHSESTKKTAQHRKNHKRYRKSKSFSTIDENSKVSDQPKTIPSVWQQGSLKTLFPDFKSKEDEELELAKIMSLNTLKYERGKRRMSDGNLKIIDKNSEDNDWGKVHKNLPESLSTDSSNKEIKQGANGDFIDKYGRVGGFTEKHLFQGEGARRKEQKFLKTADVDISKNKQGFILAQPFAKDQHKKETTVQPSNQTKGIEPHNDSGNQLANQTKGFSQTQPQKETLNQTQNSKSEVDNNLDKKNHQQFVPNTNAATNRPIHGRSFTEGNSTISRNVQKPGFNQSSDENKKGISSVQNLDQQNRSDQFHRRDQENYNRQQNYSSKSSYQDNQNKQQYSHNISANRGTSNKQESQLNYDSSSKTNQNYTDKRNQYTSHDDRWDRRYFDHTENQGHQNYSDNHDYKRHHNYQNSSDNRKPNHSDNCDNKRHQNYQNTSDNKKLNYSDVTDSKKNQNYPSSVNSDTRAKQNYSDDYDNKRYQDSSESKKSQTYSDHSNGRWNLNYSDYTDHKKNQNYSDKYDNKKYQSNSDNIDDKRNPNYSNNSDNRGHQQNYSDKRNLDYSDYRDSRKYQNNSNRHVDYSDRYRTSNKSRDDENWNTEQHISSVNKNIQQGNDQNAVLNQQFKSTPIARNTQQGIKSLEPDQTSKQLDDQRNKSQDFKTMKTDTEPVNRNLGYEASKLKIGSLDDQQNLYPPSTSNTTLTFQASKTASQITSTLEAEKNMKSEAKPNVVTSFEGNLNVRRALGLNTTVQSQVSEPVQVTSNNIPFSKPISSATPQAQKLSTSMNVNAVPFDILNSCSVQGSSDQRISGLDHNFLPFGFPNIEPTDNSNRMNEISDACQELYSLNDTVTALSKQLQMAEATLFAAQVKFSQDYGLDIVSTLTQMPHINILPFMKSPTASQIKNNPYISSQILQSNSQLLMENQTVTSMQNTPTISSEIPYSTAQLFMESQITSPVQSNLPRQSDFPMKCTIPPGFAPAQDSQRVQITPNVQNCPNEMIHLANTTENRGNLQQVYRQQIINTHLMQQNYQNDPRVASKQFYNQ